MAILNGKLLTGITYSAALPLMRIRVFFLTFIFFCGVACKEKPKLEAETAGSNLTKPERPAEKKGKLVNVKASSTLKKRHSVRKLFDYDFDSSWVEGKKDDGIGETLSFEFSAPTQIKELHIRNGYGEEQYWSQNNRVKEVEFSNEAGKKFSVTLDDAKLWQTVKIPAGFTASTMTLTIKSVYAGEKFKDTAIAEIDFGDLDDDLWPGNTESSADNLPKWAEQTWIANPGPTTQIFTTLEYFDGEWECTVILDSGSRGSSTKGDCLAKKYRGGVKVTIDSLAGAAELSNISWTIPRGGGKDYKMMRVGANDSVHAVIKTHLANPLEDSSD